MSKFASTPEEMDVGGSLQTEMKSAMARLASAQSKGDQDEIKRSQYDVDSITYEMNELSRKGGSKLGGLIPVPDVPAPQAPAQAAVQPLAGSKIGYDAWDQTGASIKASAPVVVPYAFPADGTPKPVTGPGTVVLEANAEFAGAAKDYAATQSISFVDQLKADWGVNGVSAQFSEFMRARDQVPTKGFSPFKHEPTAYVGKDEEGFEILDGAVNVQDFEERKARLKQIEDARRVTFAHGALQGFGVSMATSLPTDLAIGLIATRSFAGLGIGAILLAKRGKKLAALASSYAEAAVSNLAVTGTMDALGQHTDGTAYAADLVASLLGPAAEARSIGRLATAAEFERTAAQVAAARMTRIERLATEARANLPANASKQEVEAEIAKLEAQKMVEATTPAQGNRLLDELEELADEAEQPAEAIKDPSEFTGVVRGVHGSERPVSDILTPDAVDNDLRYDGDGGTFGGGFYSAEDYGWFRGSSMRMPQFTYATDVDTTFDRALVITPETYHKLDDLMEGAPQFGGLDEWFKSKGYDGVIVRGFPEELDGALYPKYQDLLQNQVVSFDPKNKVKVVGDNPRLAGDLQTLRDIEDKLTKASMWEGMEADGVAPSPSHAYRDFATYSPTRERGIKARARAAAGDEDYAREIKKYDESGIEELVTQARAALDKVHSHIEAPSVRGVYGSETPEFKEWFGDSKVVDEQGKPLVVYHGTSADVPAFDPGQLRAEGIHLTTDASVASKYAASRSMDGGRGANVIPVYVKADRILDVPMISTAVIKDAAASGFDAVRRGNHIVVMRPEQVKSAIGNTGKFDPNSPSLTDSRFATQADQINAAIADIRAARETANVQDAPSVKAYAYDDADLAARARAAMDSADKTATMDLIGRQGDDARIKNYIPEDAPTHVKDAGLAVEDLARTFLPDHVRVGVAWTPGQSVSGFAESSGPVVRIGLSDIGTSGGKGLQVAVHEVTHAMNAYYLPNYVNKPALLADFGKFIDTVKSGDLEKATRMRWASKSEPVNPKRAYDLNFDEWLAEQSAKYANETAAAGGNPGLRAELTAKLREWAGRVLALFGKAKDKGYIPVDQSVKDYVDAIRKREVQPVKFARPVTALSDAGPTIAKSMDDPIARKYGLDLMPSNNPRAAAEQKQLIGLYRRADAWAQANPMDANWVKRVDTLNKNRLFNVASTSANMLMSKNPVARMLAAELLESPSGVAGRKATASIRKYMAERKLMGNSINEFQTAFDQYRKLNGIGWSDNFMGSKGWRDFNRAVSLEIEGRKSGRPSQFDESIRLGADVMEAGYERARLMQVEGRTTGFGNLPDSSVGYMPHRMSALTIRNATPEQLRAVHGVLTDQFIEGNGFDLTFADKLASKYLERVQRRAVGDYDGAIGVNQVGSMDLIEEAVEELGLTAPELRAVKEKLSRAGAGHTKTRLKLDLNKEIGDGTRLVDLFETDHIKLLRGQAHRVSGEFALAQHGIMGMGGLKTLRKALQFGEGGAKAEEEAIAAFDQVAAEFMGQPFGNSIGKYGDRVMILNSLSRLGGMGFTQLAEAVNGVPAVGFMRTLNSMGSMGRLNSEIRAMARGEKVDNPILGSVEQWGAEFGTDSYKLVFPFDVPDHAYSTYGTDTVSNADRLLRMASHAQAKVTFWRAIHGAQQRGMAEQVVRKAATFLRNGGEDKALADMGFNPDLLARLRGDLDNMAKWDGDKLIEFDINKATDREAAEAFVHAVHRGTSQIIQGTFIGETGKWAHEGWLKILTQFRTFSIVAMEKQWGRNANNYGAAKAAGILLGSMIMVAPIAMARAYAASVGRENQDEYLEKRLTFGAISRATLTMVANSGYAPDVLDALGAVTGTAEMTGGRAGTESQAVGNLVAPSVGWVDDVWGGVQNTRDGTDPTKLMRTLPFGNHPALTPIINSLAQ